MIFLIIKNNFHYPREFILHRKKKNIYIYTEKYDEISMQLFINELNKLDIYEQLNQNIDIMKYLLNARKTCIYQKGK